MTKQFTCPDCGNELDPLGTSGVCHECDETYSLADLALRQHKQTKREPSQFVLALRLIVIVIALPASLIMAAMACAGDWIIEQVQDGLWFALGVIVFLMLIGVGLAIWVTYS